MRDLLGFIVGGGAGLLVGILIGAAIFGAYGFFSSGGTNIPYAQDHVKIAEGFRVKDVTWNKELTRHHIQTGPIEFSPYSPSNIYFPTHIRTTQSLWTFTSVDDIDIVMIIYGPGNDTKTYLVSFNRVMANQVSINGWGKTLSWPAGASPGWEVIDIKLS